MPSQIRDGSPILSAFAGYELIVDPSLSADGMQKKSQLTGFYQAFNSDNRYYIKQSALYPGDDIAEVLVSHLLQSTYDHDSKQLFAECNFIQANTGEIYVSSKMSKRFEPLYKKLPKKKGLGHILNMGSRISDYNKNFLFHSLTPSQNKQLSDHLARLILVRDYDGTVKNFGTDENGNVVKIDHGWALHNICKTGKKLVNIFTTRIPFYSRRLQQKGLKPINHFKDYPDIVNSEIFVQSLNDLVKKKMSIKEEGFRKIQTEQFTILLNMLKTNDLKWHALSTFAAKIGLPNHETPLNLTDESIKKYLGEITKSLSAQLMARTYSLMITRDILSINLTLKKYSKKPPSIIAIKEILNILNAIQNTAYTYFPGKSFVHFLPKDGPEGGPNSGMSSLINIFKLLAKNLNDNIALDELNEIKELVAFFQKINNQDPNAELSNLLNTILTTIKTSALHNQSLTLTYNAYHHRQAIKADATNKKQNTMNFTANINKIELEKFYNIMRVQFENRLNPHLKNCKIVKTSLPFHYNINISGQHRISVCPAPGNEGIVIKALDHETDEIIIAIMAIALIAAKDSSPKITAGTPEQILSLMNSIIKHQERANHKIKTLQLDINLNTQFNEAQKKEFETLNIKLAKITLAHNQSNAP